MMSNTLGAPFGGTTRGAHHGVDSDALSLITPPNFGSGGGSCFPVIVIVALGDPGTPVVCCADVETPPRTRSATNESYPNFMAKAPIKPRIQERFMEIYESISSQAE
jgi:hypothetical protein